MRFYSLLLVAVHFACLHTSSTRSLSTSMNITEERTSNMPNIGQSAEVIPATLSKGEDMVVRWSLRSRLKNRIQHAEVKKLRPADITQLRLMLYISYLREYPGWARQATREVLRYLKVEGVAEMIDALKEAKFSKTFADKLIDEITKYVGDAKEPPEVVFKLLKLDKPDSLDNSQVYTTNELERFKMWLKFSTTKSDLSIAEISNGFDVGIRVKILDGLRRIGDTQNVKSMEEALLQSLRHFNKEAATDIPKVFRLLGLDHNLDHLLSQQNLELFHGYAAEAFPELSKEDAFFKGTRNEYYDVYLGKMLYAAMEKNDAEAKLLLEHLLRQWEEDTRTGADVFDGVARGELRKKYDAYVKEFKKREDA